MLRPDLLARAEHIVEKGKLRQKDDMLRGLAMNLVKMAREGGCGEELECVVCMERLKSVCVLPCQHVCMCVACSESVR